MTRDLGKLADETIDKWIARQGPWPLNKALVLLCGADPDVLQTNIDPDNDDEHDILKRALEYVKLAIKKDQLHDLNFSNAPQSLASDFEVNKREFIAWAKSEWRDGASARLAERLTAYDALPEKPFQRTRPDKATRTKALFEDVANTLSPPEWRRISKSEVFKRMRKSRSMVDDAYGRSWCYEHLDQWIEEHLRRLPDGDKIVEFRRTRNLLK